MQGLNYFAAPGVINMSEVLAMEVVKIACEHFDVPVKHIMGRSRRQAYVNPRFTAIWILRHDKKMTLKSIGDLFGRDHSAVSNAIETTDKWIATEDWTRKHILPILIKLGVNGK